jgi:hypothetical protein
MLSPSSEIARTDNSFEDVTSVVAEARRSEAAARRSPPSAQAVHRRLRLWTNLMRSGCTKFAPDKVTLLLPSAFAATMLYWFPSHDRYTRRRLGVPGKAGGEGDSSLGALTAVVAVGDRGVDGEEEAVLMSVPQAPIRIATATSGNAFITVERS